MDDPVPAGYEFNTFWHSGHLPCPKTGDPTPLILIVPIDKAGWLGVSCAACGQPLTQS